PLPPPLRPAVPPDRNDRPLPLWTYNPRMKSAATSALLLFAAVSTIFGATKPAPKPFSVVEASIADMQAALRDGRVTSHELVQQYLLRIATHEDKLHAAITV